MDRDLEIQKIAKRIQKDIDKLKKLNVHIDYTYNSLCLFDDDITPIKGASCEDDEIVFTFKTSK
jgi:hypothetical protein